MRTIQIVLAITTLLAVLGMFGFNLWMGANFANGMQLPKCYTPLNYIAAGLVLLTVLSIFIRK